MAQFYIQTPVGDEGNYLLSYMGYFNGRQTNGNPIIIEKIIIQYLSRSWDIRTVIRHRCLRGAVGKNSVTSTLGKTQESIYHQPRKINGNLSTTVLLDHK